MQRLHHPYAVSAGSMLPNILICPRFIPTALVHHFLLSSIL